MPPLPRLAALYIAVVCAVGVTVLALTARSLEFSPTFLTQAALFVGLAVIADRKQLRLESANYSVATATNFACAIVLGPAAAAWVSAVGSAAGDLTLRKPLHKVAFNAAAISLSTFSGAVVMASLRTQSTAVIPSDLPGFVAYAVTHNALNVLLVCTVIALATHRSVWSVVWANHRGLLVPIVALYPLGLLMAVVYAAFGGWMGLLLLVVPVISAYAALDHAQRLREANAELRRTAEHNAELYTQVRNAHEQLAAAHEQLAVTHEQLRSAHEQLKQTQQQIVEQERLRALGQMASGIAHDFNNALAPVVGFSELLLLQPERWHDHAHLRRQLELIHTAAGDAANVVRQLREFYRKREEYEALVPVDLNALVTQVVEITQPKWRGQAQGAGITIQVATALDPVPPVLGDQSSLREALTNLVFNAVDAMPDGGRITLTTRAQDGQVVVEVSDTGTGMAEQVRQRCLDPFFTTKGPSGTGMGLSMVHGIVRRHSGTLEIQSAWGEGTTIRIALPAQVKQQPAGSGIAPASSPAAAGAPTAQAARTTPDANPPLNILIVDDDPGVRDLLRAYLTTYGFAGEVAGSGMEGLQRFQNGRFDLVITDRAMPDMNGDHLARAVKTLDRRVPVIMLTGFGDMLHALDEHPDAVDLVLNKPVSYANLRRAIDQLTNGDRQRAIAAPIAAAAGQH